MLLEAFLDITSGWRGVFRQQRSFSRALRQSLGGLLCLGRHTLSRIIWTNGDQQPSWSAEYFLHSRAQWDAQQLFAPIIQRGLTHCPGRLVGVAVDDTRLRKTGRKIPQAAYHRDPMSPPFHPNLMLGLRFLQASLLIPLHRRDNTSCRAVPIRFEEVSVVRRPRRRAPEEAWKQYRQDVKQHNLSQHFVQTMEQLRTALDQAGGHKKVLVIAGDGSFCNRTVFARIVPRTELIARCRQEAALCFHAPAASRCFYDPCKFTPEQVRQDETRPWQTSKLFYGSKRHKIRFKEVGEVYWQGGARRRLLRLFVIAPTAYRKRKNGRLFYRRPAFLLTTDFMQQCPPIIADLL